MDISEPPSKGPRLGRSSLLGLSLLAGILASRIPLVLDAKKPRPPRRQCSYELDSSVLAYYVHFEWSGEDTTAALSHRVLLRDYHLANKLLSTRLRCWGSEVRAPTVTSCLELL
jgi:hypothetical protein